MKKNFILTHTVNVSNAFHFFLQTQASTNTIFFFRERISFNTFDSSADCFLMTIFFKS